MGRPKEGLRVRGRAVLVHLLERFAWLGPTLLVVAPGRPMPAGAELFSRVLTDSVAGEGPLRGVLTALEQAATAITLIATVDMPEIAGVHLMELAREMIERPDCRVLMFRRGDEASESLEPFPSAFRSSAIDLVREQLQSGRRAVRGLVGCPRVEAIAAPKAWGMRIWTNLNEPGDLEDYSG